MSTDKLRKSFSGDLEKLKDRTSDVRAVCNRILESWTISLKDRKPGIAYIDENGTPIVTYDMAALMHTLMRARAVVNIPAYTVRRAKTITEGEVLVDNANRHGPVIGMVSNATVFSFGILVDDAQVVGEGRGTMEGEAVVGKPRAFMVQDVTGAWYDGWKSIDMIQAGLDKETYEALQGITSAIKFKYFIHPNRWPSFYGRPYLLAKCAVVRLKDQEKFLKGEIKKLEDALEVEKQPWPKSTTVGEVKEIDVWAFESKVEGFAISGKYTKAADKAIESEDTDVMQAVLDRLTGLKKRFRGFITELSFQIRATEYSFWTNGVLPNIDEDNIIDWVDGAGNAQPRRPGWVKGKEWENGYKVKRTKFARMEMRDGLKILWRVRRKKEKVSAESEDK